MSKVADHLHRFKRVNIGENGKKFFVYRCTKPACTHYIAVKMAEGVLCECNRCGNAMLLSKEAMQLAKPHCIDCVKRKKVTPETIEAMNQFLNKIPQPQD